MKLIKEILLFIFNLSMLFWALYIITFGAKNLGLGVFSLIPFLYLFYFFTKDIPSKEERIKELENNLEYYKHQLKK
jgi:hypothetical protein